MLKIRQYSVNGRDDSFEVPCDDYTFNAVILQGPIVSKPDHSVHRDAIMISPSAVNYVFKMTLLEASRIVELHPQFCDGLIGLWSLSTTGFLKLIKIGPTASSQIQEYLLMQNSAEFVRNHYK